MVVSDGTNMHTQYLMDYIGKYLKERYKETLENNYYKAWIEAYAGKDFEVFSVESCRLLDRLCEGISAEEEEHLIQIFLKACEHEMAFWEMSYRINEGGESC